MPTATANGKKFTFPEGTTPEQMGDAIDEFFAGNSTPVDQVQSPAKPQPIEESIPEQIAVGLGAGTTNFLEGVEQSAQKLNVDKAARGERINSALGGGALGFSIDPANPAPTMDERALSQLEQQIELDDMTERSQKRRQEFRESPIGSSTLGKASEFVGELASGLVVPSGGRTIAQRALSEGLAGGVTEGVSFTEDDTNLERGAGGAGGAAAFSVATGNLGKLYRAFRGADSAEFSTQIKKLSDDNKVPVTVGEMRNSPFFQRVETFLERVPVLGIGGFRERQAEAITSAATRLTDLPGVKPDDIGRSIKMSLDRVSKANRKKSNIFYDRVENAVRAAGDNPVSLDSTRQAASSLIESLSRNADLAQESNLLQRVGLFTEAAPRSFQDVRALRSDLLREVRKLERQKLTGNADTRDIGALKQLASAVDNDLTNFAKGQGEEIEGLFRQANDYWKSNVLPFQRGDLGRVTQSEFDTDQILARFIKGDQKLKPSANRARELVDNLDVRGKKAVQHAILNNAFETAMDESREIFSPQKFANELKRLSTANDVIFDKAQKNQIDGFVKLAEVAKRAGQFAENQPTGQRLVDAVTGGGTAIAGGKLLAGDPTGAVILGSVKGASLLLTTGRGRAILTTINSSKEGSKNFIRGLRLANEEITRISSRIAAEYGADFNEAQTPGTESTETSQE